jgi:Tfp pilus assembly protein PilF
MTKQQLPIHIAILLTVVLFLLASLYPIQWAWGLNHLQFLPEYLRWVWGLVLIGILLFLYVPIGNKTLQTAIARVDSVLINGRILPRAALLLVSAAVFYLLHLRTHFSGDGYTWLANFGQQSGYFWKFTEPGSIYLVRFIQSLQGGYTQATALTAFRIISVLSGVIVVYNFIDIARRLCLKQSVRVVTLGSLFFSGGMLLFFGYVEFYPLLWAAGTTYINLALKYLDTGKRPHLMIAAFAIAALVHLQALYLLPGLVYILVRGKFGRGFLKASRKFFWPLVGLAGIGAFVGYVWLHENNLEFHSIFLHPFEGKPPANDYAVFSPKHLVDIMNLLIMVFPAIIIAVVTWIFYRNGERRTERTIFLTLTATGSMAFLFLVDPALGMARDWDLMSFAAMPVLLLILHQIDHREHVLSAKVVISWLVISMMISASYIASNVAVAASEDRAHSLLRYYGSKDRSGWAILANYWHDKGDVVKAKAINEETTRLFPNFELLRLGEEHLNRGEFAEAEAITLRLVRNDPHRAEFIQLLADIYSRSNRFEEAEKLYKKALRLKPKSPPLNYSLGQMYVTQSRFREGLKLLKSARQLDPTEDYITEAIGLAYLNSGYPDSAASIADTLLVADSCSAGGHLLKMMLSVKTGDHPAAQYHYRRYADCGAGREEYEYMLQRYSFIMQ